MFGRLATSTYPLGAARPMVALLLTPAKPGLGRTVNVSPVGGRHRIGAGTQVQRLVWRLAFLTSP